MNALGFAPDIAGAYARGREGYEARQEGQRQNALREAMQQYGPAAMQGDQNALRQLAQYDPQAALDMMGSRQTMDINSQQNDRQARAADQTFQVNEQQMRLARQEGNRQAQTQAAQMDANKRAETAEKLGQATAAMAEAWKGGPEAFQGFMTKFGPNMPDNLKGTTYEDAPYVGAFLTGTAEGFAAPEETSQTRELKERAAAAGVKPGSPEYNDLMLSGPVQRTEDMTQTFRPASPQEASTYGASAGQIDNKTGRFYPAETRDTTSEGERKAAGMLDRMTAAEKTIESLAAGGASNLSLAEKGLKNVGVPEGYALSADSQQVLQAQRDWVRAKLRLESGAVIGDEEMAEEIRTYFPQPGEDPATAAQKKQARAQAMEQVRTQGGRAASKPAAEAGSMPPAFAETGLSAETWGQLTPEEQAVWMN